MASILSFISRMIIRFIKLYQKMISPILMPCCRFRPSCSQYGIDAFRHFGEIKGCWLTVKRILKCHPFCHGGEDPIPLTTTTRYQSILTMDAQRNLIIIWLFLSFIIWQIWEQDKNLQMTHKIMPIKKTQINNNIELGISDKKQEEKVTIKTDVLELTINPHGGDIEKALLLAYPKELGSIKPFQLLETTPEFIYQAQSGLIGRDGPDSLIKNCRPFYKVNKDLFILTYDQNKLVVPMTYQDSSGNTFIKTFTLKKQEYVVDVDYSIQNNDKKPLEISVFGQLRQSINTPDYLDIESKNLTLHAFRGAAYSTVGKKYEKYKFSTISDNENLNINSKNGWIAMLQQYFATAWIPRNDIVNNFYTANLDNKVVAIGFKSQPILVKPGHTIQLKNTLWIGPKIQDKMASASPNLDLTVDYGWLWFISQPLFKLLKFIYRFFGNWGFSIIFITFVVRGVMYPLNRSQYIAMAKIRMLHPKIQDIYSRFKDDKQRISQEIVVLYKKEKVSPLGGCFPILIQMPIFLALYYMLVGSVELRQAPFILWIRDLSAQDPYYILPILMGVTMHFIQKISPTTVSDPIQKKIIKLIPVIFTIFFLWFPSGLVLYYIVSNLVTIIQQQQIYRSLEKRGLYIK